MIEDDCSRKKIKQMKEIAPKTRVLKIQRHHWPAIEIKDSVELYVLIGKNKMGKLMKMQESHGFASKATAYYFLAKLMQNSASGSKLHSKESTKGLKDIFTQIWP